MHRDATRQRNTRRSDRKIVLVPGHGGGHGGAVRDAVETALRPVLTWDSGHAAVAAWARARCPHMHTLFRRALVRAKLLQQVMS